MKAPVPIGLCRDEFHRYWWQGAGPIVSITTAIKAVDKSGPLMGWAKRLTAEAAVRNLDLVHRMVQEGGEQAGVEFLKKLADYKRDRAADLGTRVHALAEAIARGQAVEIVDEERPYVEAYRAWMVEWQPKFLAAEYMVCSLSNGYAGTGDLVVAMGGEHWRLDTKTSAGVYAETALQLAAAHYADFSGRPGDPKQYRVPQADRCGVLHLRGDGTYAVVPFEVNEDTFAAFLAARHLWGWLQGAAKSIVGQPALMEAAVA